MYRHFLRILQAGLAVFLILILLGGCASNCADRIISVTRIGKDENVLRHKLKVVTKTNTDLFIRYWEKGNKDTIFTTEVSKDRTIHYPVMAHLKQSSAYEYEIIVQSNKCESISKAVDFTTAEIPIAVIDLVSVAEKDESFIPEIFSNGYVLTGRRDLPGYIFIVDAKGSIVWYEKAQNSGFKVTHFTKSGSILSIMAPLSYPTSYGNEILEINLEGDTLFHLIKGEKGFDKTIHHEILRNDSNQLVTLTLEERIFDLRSIGGKEKDTVTGDGILVLDQDGNKVGSWTIFDELDPKSDPNILKDKSDWLHANSLFIDRDGNYIVSFYLSGQIWKINSKTGKVLWKMGRGGNLSMTKGSEFSESHAVHLTSDNHLMLFENGTDKKRSRVLNYSIDEHKQTAILNSEIILPVNLYSQRMGSAYSIDNSHLLICSAQEHAIVLTDTSGKVLWRLRTGFIPYRAEFIGHDSFFRQSIIK